MKRNQGRYLFVTGVAGFLLTSPVGASTPLWTFSAPNPATTIVSDGGTGTVVYTITNQSRKSKNLILKNTSGLHASSCILPTKGSTCTLTLTVNGGEMPAEGIHSGPLLCEQGNLNQCYQPSASNLLNVGKNNVTTTSLQTSVSDLALSVAGLTEFGLPLTTSGIPRVITITNTGSAAATGLLVTPSGLPSGTTTQSPACAGTLAAGSTCTITITPGLTATSDGTNPCSSGTAPVPGSVQVRADNANTVSTNVVVLDYRCVYQGGFVYAFDDTTPNTGSVGGKVVTTYDQEKPFPDGIVWSSNDDFNGSNNGFNPSDTSLDILPGIDETSVSATGSPTYTTFSSFFSNTYTNTNPFNATFFLMCNGISDGACNTHNILTFYNQFQTYNRLAIGTQPPFSAKPEPTSLYYYAAGSCKQMIAGYSDWYLPAICEMGYGSSACGTSDTPTLQNMYSSLIDKSRLSGAPTGIYWSSTESSSAPQSNAWGQDFFGDSNQQHGEKYGRLGVRCSRALTL